MARWGGGGLTVVAEAGSTDPVVEVVTLGGEALHDSDQPREVE